MGLFIKKPLEALQAEANQTGSKSYRDIRRLRRITAKLSQSHEWQGLGIDKRNLGKI